MLFRSGTSATLRANTIRIALHELGHAWVFSLGRNHVLHRLRTEFYEERTRGEEARRLRTFGNALFTLGMGYSANERYRPGFVDAYMGKENGVELFGSGLEYVFFNRHDIWRGDPEVTKFILGSLIFCDGLEDAVEYRRVRRRN